MRSELMGVDSVDGLNAVKDKIDNAHPLVREMKQSVMQMANTLGAVFNQETGKFELANQGQEQASA